MKLAPCFFEPPPSADLSVLKTASSSVMILGQLTYTLTVRNAGPSRATAVTLVDTLPAEAQPVSATPAQGSCSTSGRTVTCTLGALDPGASTTATIVVSAPLLPGTLTNTATVSGAEPDPDLSNNTSSATTQVGLLPGPPAPPAPSPTPAPSPSPSILGELVPPPAELPRTGPALPLGLLVLLGLWLTTAGIVLVVRRRARPEQPPR